MGSDAASPLHARSEASQPGFLPEGGVGRGLVQADTYYPSVGSSEGCRHQGEQAQKAPRFSFLRPVFQPPLPLPITSLSWEFRCSFTWEVQCFPGGCPGGQGHTLAPRTSFLPCIQFISPGLPWWFRLRLRTSNLPMQETLVQSLVRELDHLLCGTAIKRKKNLTSEERVPLP